MDHSAIGPETPSAANPATPPATHEPGRQDSKPSLLWTALWATLGGALGLSLGERAVHLSEYNWRTAGSLLVTVILAALFHHIYVSWKETAGLGVELHADAKKPRSRWLTFLLGPCFFVFYEILREFAVEDVKSGVMVGSAVVSLIIMGGISMAWIVGLRAVPSHAAFTGGLWGGLSSVVVLLLYVQSCDIWDNLNPLDLVERVPEFDPAQAGSAYIPNVFMVMLDWVAIGLVGGAMLDLKRPVKWIWFALAIETCIVTCLVQVPLSEFPPHKGTLTNMIKFACWLWFLTIGLRHQNVTAESPPKPSEYSRRVILSLFCVAIGLAVLGFARWYMQEAEARTKSAKVATVPQAPAKPATNLVLSLPTGTWLFPTSACLVTSRQITNQAELQLSLIYKGTNTTADEITYSILYRPTVKLVPTTEYVAFKTDIIQVLKLDKSVP